MTASASRNRYGAQRARAELFGSIGAGVLGAGLALLFRQPLAAFTVPFLAVGGIVHALAMLEKHRLDATSATVVPRWTQWTYLLCWILLLGLLAYVW